MTKTSKPLRVTTNEDGSNSFTLNTKKPVSVTVLENGNHEVTIANAVLEIDLSGEHLSIKAKKIAKSIDGLDTGDIFCDKDGSIMVVE